MYVQRIIVGWKSVLVRPGPSLFTLPTATTRSPLSLHSTVFVLFRFFLFVNSRLYTMDWWTLRVKKGKGSPDSITERRVPELITVLGSQPAGDVSHKPGGRLPLLSARPTVTHATLKRGCSQFYCLVNRGTMGVNSLPKTVTPQRAAAI